MLASMLTALVLMELLLMGLLLLVLAFRRVTIPAQPPPGHFDEADQVALAARAV